MDSSAHDPLDEEYKDLRKALQAITSAAGGLNIAHGKLLQHTASVVTTVESFHRAESVGPYPWKFTNAEAAANKREK
eukprot:m.287492 g.287492  ORF g.287492 m.287492 type:complete len:77 (-) comp19947_c0_seq1:3003-3233(-)